MRLWRRFRRHRSQAGARLHQVFDSNDQPLEIIGGPGAEPGRFSNPWGVALDSAGNLYVADSQNHRVQKFIRANKAPNSKLQAPDKLQTPTTKAAAVKLTSPQRLEVGAWNFSGCWSWELGTYPPIT